jgi:MFS family permease
LLGGVLADVGWRIPFLIYLSSLVLLPLMVRSLYEPATTESTGSIPRDLASLRRTLREIPVRLLALIYGIILFGQIVSYMIPVHAPFYIQDLTGATGTLVGLAIAVASMTGGALASQYQSVRARLGVVRVVAVVFGLVGIGYVIVGVSATYLQILAGLAIAGAGLGLFIPNLSAWISAEIPDDFRGSALGGLTSFLFLGRFLSPIATQPISARIGLGAAYAAAGLVLLVLAVEFIGLGHRVRVPAPQERVRVNQ